MAQGADRTGRHHPPSERYEKSIDVLWSECDGERDAGMEASRPPGRNPKKKPTQRDAPVRPPRALHGSLLLEGDRDGDPAQEGFDEKRAAGSSQTGYPVLFPGVGAQREGEPYPTGGSDTRDHVAARSGDGGGISTVVEGSR